MRWSRRRYARARKQSRRLLVQFVHAAHAESFRSMDLLEAYIPIELLYRAECSGAIQRSWLSRRPRVVFAERFADEMARRHTLAELTELGFVRLHYMDQNGHA